MRTVLSRSGIIRHTVLCIDRNHTVCKSARVCDTMSSGRLCVTGVQYQYNFKVTSILCFHPGAEGKILK